MFGVPLGNNGRVGEYYLNVSSTQHAVWLGSGISWWDARIYGPPPFGYSDNSDNDPIFGDAAGFDMIHNGCCLWKFWGGVMIDGGWSNPGREPFLDMHANAWAVQASAESIQWGLNARPEWLYETFLQRDDLATMTLLVVPHDQPRRQAGWPKELNAAVDVALAAEQVCPPDGVSWADWDRGKRSAAHGSEAGS